MYVPAGVQVESYDAEAYAQSLRRLFSRCDLTGDGQLSKAEIIKVCRQDIEVAQLLGLSIGNGSRDSLEQFFQGLDLDGSGTISWVEFHNWFSSHPYVSESLRLAKSSDLQQAVSPAFTSSSSMNNALLRQSASLKPATQQLHMMMVTVPDGAEPGQLIQFRASDGTMMQVSVPEGEKPGNEFQVQISHVAAQDGLVVTLTVPEGVEPGQIVLFDAPDGTCMRVFVPEGRAPGAEFQVMLAPPTTQVKLVVPSGMRGGEELEFQSPDGSHMRTQVPVGLTAGDTFAVNVRRPVTNSALESQSQVASKDGLTVPSGSDFNTAALEKAYEMSVDSGLSPNSEAFKATSNSFTAPSSGFPVSSGSPAPNYAVAEPSRLTAMAVPTDAYAAPNEQVVWASGAFPSPHAVVAEPVNGGQDNGGLGQLCSAVGAGHLEAVMQCVAEGVSVNGVYDAGFTPLFYAAIDGQPHVAQWLLEQGADVLARNDEQRTPLHWAARSGHAEVVQLLLAAQADPSAQDGTGRTPLALARQKGQLEAAAVLEAVDGGY